MLLRDDDDSHIGSEVMAVRAEVARLQSKAADIIIGAYSRGTLPAESAQSTQLSGRVDSVDSAEWPSRLSRLS